MMASIQRVPGASDRAACRVTCLNARSDALSGSGPSLMAVWVSVKSVGTASGVHGLARDAHGIGEPMVGMSLPSPIIPSVMLSTNALNAQPDGKDATGASRRDFCGIRIPPTAGFILFPF
jgi:hypothetical protein